MVLVDTSVWVSHFRYGNYHLEFEFNVCYCPALWAINYQEAGEEF